MTLPGKDFRNVKAQQSFLSLSPGEDGFCTFEIKHGGRLAPGSKLFVSARRLQERRSQTLKNYRGFVFGEDIFCSLETS
jgi:hypothetical protein